MMCMQGGYVKVFSEARGIESPGAGFTDGWELPDVGAGNPIQAFHKNSVCSSWLRYLYSPWQLSS